DGEKGRWKCTRPGGACEQGPLPDGSCCRPIPKCSPVRSLRARRGLFTWTVLAVTAGALLVLLGGSWRNNFINPGGLSDPHSSRAFAALAHGTNCSDQTCASCHAAGGSGPGGLMQAAFSASPGPFEWHKLADATRTDMTSIDHACTTCHAGHAFHEPNVVRDHSCSLCHAEHLGAGPMRAPTDANCASCHANEPVMFASTQMGRKLPPSAFEFRPGRGLKEFRGARPAQGYTKVFRSFSDHPEFRVHADRQRDPDTLKFGHALHLTSETIPKLPNGRKLDCTFCHQPDASIARFQPVKFEQHCRVCHSLQFDPETPELTLPHGEPRFVSAFLASLARQYGDYARERKGLKRDADAQAFAETRLHALQEQTGSRGELEKRVFFSTSTHGPASQIGTLGGAARALYPGCAYCHEVKADAAGAAHVTPALVPDRWLPHGDFTHARHTQVACANCHDTIHSKETSDIILPAKASCATCHSPAGGVKSSCSTCHAYHNEPPKKALSAR
ncbi:MAG TPA: hypothetical protein VI454_07170, partial [Verrucomicrobiae bacterium]